jgi:tRNA 2-selenouridine synthase
MAVQKITIEPFLAMAAQHTVLDVRSPGEYLHAHIPGACSLPLFTDEERKVVGTAYKQQSREIAIKIGLDYFGVKMRGIVEVVENLLTEKKIKKGKQESISQQTVLVHCWRGGMRSAGIAWLLDLYGFKVYTLVGGYKTYRQWARTQFEKKHNFTIVGGYTGTGKTLVLKELKRAGNSIIDLEGLANHKGSAFGALGEEPQPSQEMFENLLAVELAGVSHQGNIQNESTSLQTSAEVIYMEDESQRIGLLNIPNDLWDSMRKSPITFINIPFEERLNYLSTEYGKFEKEKLVNAIIRIQKRLGGLETKTAINYLLENNHKECFRILLKYYDKYYEKGLHNREPLSELLTTISFNTMDVAAIAQSVMVAKRAPDNIFVANK